MKQILKIKKDFLKKNDFQYKPDLFWKIILYMTFAIILVSFAFGFYLFTQINKEQIEPLVGASLHANTVKKERMEKALGVFFERDKKSIEILNSPSSIIDPSL